MRTLAVFLVLSLYVASCLTGCAATDSVQAKADDVAKIELADAICLANHIQLPDAEIVQACSPGGDPVKALQMAVYVSYCRFGLPPGYFADGGPD